MKKEDIKPNTFPKYKPNPILAGLPDYLKDHANFKKIQLALLNAGATRHSHAEVLEWAGCKACQQKQWDRKEMMKKLGFRSGAQYLMWFKIHKQIDSMERVPLVDWKKK